MPKERKAKIEKKSGVTLTAWKGHPVYRWRVSFSDGGKRKSKGFKTKAGKDGAQAYADQKRGDLDAYGNRHEAITDDERRAVMAFREIVESLPESVIKPPLAEIVEEYRKRADVRKKSMTIRELNERYLNSLEKRKLSDQYQYSTKLRLEKFEEDLGDWMACDISPEVVGDWLHELDLAPQTVNHYRAAIVQAFNFGMKIKAIDSNPADAVDKLKQGVREVGILEVGEVKKLLKNTGPEICPGVSLGLFAGVRRAELNRLDWSEVDLEQGYVEIKANKSKTAARRLIPIRSNLKSILKKCGQKAGSVMPSEMVWRSRLTLALEKAGIKKWPHNALRHTFASYHLAKFQDAPALALEMGHGDTKMIFEHYRALVTPKAAKAYWKIGKSE